MDLKNLLLLLLLFFHTVSINSRKMIDKHRLTSNLTVGQLEKNFGGNYIITIYIVRYTEEEVMWARRNVGGYKPLTPPDCATDIK